MSKIYATPDPSISQREINHMKRVREIATEGMVLLENNGVLPLNSINSIALYGNGARKTVKGGTGSGDVYTRTVTNVEQGLEHAGINVTTKYLLDSYDKLYSETQTTYNNWVLEQAQPMAVMTSYNLINQVHTSDSFDLLTSVLRNEWNFKGLVMTDWGATGNLLPDTGITKYSSSKTEDCITSGNDLLMPGSENDYRHIVEGVKSGTIPLGSLQFTTRNILNVLLQTNCYDHSESYSATNLTSE